MKKNINNDLRSSFLKQQLVSLIFICNFFFTWNHHTIFATKNVWRFHLKNFRTLRLNLCIALFSPFLAYFVPSAGASTTQVVCGLISQEDLNQIYMIIWWTHVYWKSTTKRVCFEKIYKKKILKKIRYVEEGSKGQLRITFVHYISII